MHIDVSLKLAGALREMARLETELIRSERMLLLGQMATGLAHEIRNPLGSVKGAAEVILAGLPEGDRRRELAAIIVKESERLDAFLKSFVEYAGPRPYHMEDTDLRALAVECVKLMEAEASRSGVRLAVAEGGGPATAGVDADRVRQVFVNIIKNAIQAMPEGGTMTASITPGPEGVRIEFADTGPGLGEEAAKAAFEPFFTTRQGGSGLGLAIARRIVEDHGGSIAAGGAPGGGARITVTLPAAPPAARS